MPDWGTRIPRLHSTVKTNKQTKNRASKQPGNNEQNANKYIPITNYHEVTKWIKKKDIRICCLQETHFRSKDIHRLNVRGGKQQRAGAPVLTSNRTD